ncbi:MAG: sugar kinase [Clostridiales bacterium GWC2_40_7]|nr:MAG: sugar kinase [Clostridiales bacterium GWC2_40_7]
MLKCSNSFEEYKGMSEDRFNEILSRISKVKVALIGDLCLDVYWRADMRKSELSRETPHYPLPVVQEWMSPGAGGNVAYNIASLGVEKTFVIGVIGKDWRGDILKGLFSEKKGMDIRGVFSNGTRVTEAYCKPLRKGVSDVEYEDPRIDFLNYQPLCLEQERKIIDFLENVAKEVDVICVSDQSIHGCITSAVRDKINELGRDGYKIVVDSRYRIGLFGNVILKPNEVEGWRAVYGKDNEYGASLTELVSAAVNLSLKNNADVCMTLGAKGCVYTNGEKSTYIPSYEVKPPIDICGAGDTFISAFSCAVAAGAKVHEAASFANMAADVTITKVATAGTASLEEIRERHKAIFT